MEIDLNSITDLRFLDDVLLKLEETEKITNDEIIEFTSKKRDLDRKMIDLEAMLPNLNLLMSDSKNLSSMISVASELAEGVSGKVRQLDLAKSRVYSCSQRVQDILDLKACTDGVQQALRDEDYEKAAGHIHRFLSMDENVLRMTSDVSEGSTLESSFKMLHSSETKLRTIVNNQFDAAVQANDRASIERFFKIFPLIHLHKEGLEKFGKYLSASIAAKCDNHLKIADMSDPQRHGVKFADLMTVLFETIAETIETCQVQVETYYGHGHLLELVRVLQQECDRQSRRILQKFTATRDYERIVRQVQRSMTSSNRGGGGERADPKEVDPLISEIVLINTRTELFFRFIKRRTCTDVNLSANDSATKTALLKEISTFFDNCSLSRQMQELIGNYILLEEFYMREMVSKAISLDTYDESSQTSTVVDDVFFIVKKCVRRALTSSSVDGVCAMLNHAGCVLDDQFRSSCLATRIKTGFPSGWMQDAYSYVSAPSATSQITTAAGREGSSGGTVSGGLAARRLFLVTLNNVEVAKTCVKSLKDNLEQEIDSLFGGKDTSSAKSKLQTCLSELGSVANRFKDLLDTGFAFLNANVIQPQVKSFLQPFSAMKHLLTEDDLTFYEANDPWVQFYIVSSENLLTSFKSSLTGPNYDLFIQFLTNETVARLEKVIQRKSFNRLGGLQIDRDIRGVVSYLTSTTTWSVRDKFARLSQMCILLNLDKVNEVLDYWNTINWRLTPNEVRQFLTLRTDFRTEDIRKLKL